eukprot:TRINITY_DN21008_c0_g1_i1.p3 TRINITY_DN21008_c0_g1~~TRINITY_DN21008_c0_g1_i1.p3  ORF type:complete len:154 (-),score=30.90 TRINITY_DN21008_c0_g1_i1:34-495(-)
MVTAAAFHFFFEDIHPFSDGNGRLGRLLTKLLLDKHLVIPCTVLVSDQERYKAALAHEAAAHEQGITNLVEVFVAGTTDTLVCAEREVERVRALPDREIITATSAAEARQKALDAGATADVADKLEEGLKQRSYVRAGKWRAFLQLPMDVDTD